MQMAIQLIHSMPTCGPWISNLLSRWIEVRTIYFRFWLHIYSQYIYLDSKEWTSIHQYMTGTHGATHGSYTCQLRNLFRVERWAQILLSVFIMLMIGSPPSHGEAEAWEKAGWGKLGDGDKMLLWHGSRSTNFAGTLFCHETTVGCAKTSLRQVS